MGDQWIIDIESERKRRSRERERERWKNRSIYRVTKLLRDNPNIQKWESYTPQIVSFGPYHYGTEHLMPMEPVKRQSLILFLERTNTRLEDVVGATRKEVGQLRESYDELELDSQWMDDSRFLELMILDGCFMLHTILHEQSEDVRYGTGMDPIFEKPYIIAKLRLDMLRLENQLPLRVLFILSSVAGYQMEEIYGRVQCFITESSPTEDKKIFTASALHVLDLYRKCMLLDEGYMYTTTSKISATKLHESGVHFKRSQTNCYNDISFSGGVLHLPVITINDTAVDRLVNLIAFEQLHSAYNYEVMSYVFFLDQLIDTANDVSVLRNEGIIDNMLWTDGEIAREFNSIGLETWIINFEPKEKGVNEKLNEHCSKFWPRLRASFIHTYLRNLWVFFSLLGALFLLALTILQSVYTVITYYHS